MRTTNPAIRAAALLLTRVNRDLEDLYAIRDRHCDSICESIYCENCDTYLVGEHRCDCVCQDCGLAREDHAHSTQATRHTWVRPEYARVAGHHYEIDCEEVR